MIFFLDLETTGLEHETNVILEIGMLAVDETTMTEVDCFSAAITHGRLGNTLANAAFENMDIIVHEMHINNGLWMDIDQRGISLRKAVKMAKKFYEKHWDGTASEIAGFNPDFDRLFLKQYAPSLEECFHYRNFDCEAFWLLEKYRTNTQRVKSDTAHRALPDCRQALALAKRWIGK